MHQLMADCGVFLRFRFVNTGHVCAWIHLHAVGFDPCLAGGLVDSHVSLGGRFRVKCFAEGQKISGNL